MAGEKNSKYFAFRLNENIKEEKALIDFLELRGGNNVAKLVKDILQKVRKGELQTPLNEDLKLEKLKVDIEFKKVCTAIKEKELLHWKTFDKEPSPQAQRIIVGAEKKKAEEEQKKRNESPSCYDEKNHRFQCPECGILFIFAEDESDIIEAKSMFADHYTEKHGEIPEKIIRELRDL